MSTSRPHRRWDSMLFRRKPSRKPPCRISPPSPMYVPSLCRFLTPVCSILQSRCRVVYYCRMLLVVKGGGPKIPDSTPPSVIFLVKTILNRLTSNKVSGEHLPEIKVRVDRGHHGEGCDDVCCYAQICC